MKTPWILLGIGMPGSGKTTVLSKYAKEKNAVYICLDEVRAQLCADPMDQTANATVLVMVYDQITKALQQGNNVVVDSTLWKKEYRLSMISHCHKAGKVEVRGLYFDVPYDVCIARNKMRSRVVPEHAIQRMDYFLKVHPPSIQEGFDALQRISV